MSTHVYVLQRLKALGDGENEATILHWTLRGKSAERLLLRSDYKGSKYFVSAENCLSAKL